MYGPNERMLCAQIRRHTTSTIMTGERARWNMKFNSTSPASIITQDKRMRLERGLSARVFFFAFVAGQKSLAHDSHVQFDANNY